MRAGRFAAFRGLAAAFVLPLDAVIAFFRGFAMPALAFIFKALRRPFSPPAYRPPAGFLYLFFFCRPRYSRPPKTSDAPKNGPVKKYTRHTFSGVPVHKVTALFF